MAATIRIEINSTSGGRGIDDTAKGLRDLDSAARSSGSGVSSFGQVVIGALREVGAIATQSLMVAGTAIAGFVKDSIGAAGSFEAGMNTFAAASGTAGEELETFKNLFIDLGKELPVSTQEVQDAATAMVKGGIDPAVVAAGGLRDTLQFAAAAAMGLESAANLTAKQLATFVDQTASAAEKTAFMAMSQELLVKAANASTVDVEQLGEAMLMAGGSAKAAGVSYEDFVTTMGAISGAFPSAATAGTSFNNFLVRMIPSTQNAKDAMEALGLYTEETGSAFYDANGQFIGMRNAAELLQNAFTGLTDAQRNEALATIFGNDAKGAAMALLSAGAEGYDAFAASMANANGIQGQATATQQGFNFAIQNLQGSIEALQITIGSKLLPVLTPLIEQFTAGVNAVIEFASATLSADDPIAQLSAQFPLLSQAIATATASFNTIYAFIQSMMPAMMSIIQNTLTIITGLWQQHGATVMQVVQSAFTMIQGTIQIVMGVIQGILAIVLATITGDWDTAFKTLAQSNETIWNGIRTFLFGALNAIAAFFGTSVDGIITLWASNISKLATITTQAVADTLAALMTAIAPAVNIGRNIIDGLIRGVQSGVGALVSAVTNAATAALNAAKKALGISSPSAVFAAQIGLPMAQGMAVGLQQGAPLVAQSAQNTAGAAVAGAKTVTNNYNYSPTYSATPSRPSADFAMMRSLATAGT